MSDFYFTRFVDSKETLYYWDPACLAFLGLLPNRIAHLRFYEDRLRHLPTVYYKEVSRS